MLSHTHSYTHFLKCELQVWFLTWLLTRYISMGKSLYFSKLQFSRLKMGAPPSLWGLCISLPVLLQFITTHTPSHNISSVQSLSCVQLSDPMNCSTPGFPCPSPTPGVYSNSCPSSWWCHPTISSSVIPFSSCRQSFPVSGSFQMSQLFASGGQSIGALASTSVLPMNIQDWFSLGWAGLTSLQSKGLSRVFSITTIQKHQFFGAQLSL